MAAVLVLVTLCFPRICKAQPLFDAELTFKVQDDFGKPLTGVKIEISTFDHVGPGDMFGTWKLKTNTGKTDTNGLVTIRGSTKTGEFNYSIAGSSNYYAGGGEYRFRQVIDKRWQPRNPTINFILKPIVKPVAMYARKLRDVRFAELNHKYGYDLVVGDWVVPEGKGEVVDLNFELAGSWKANEDYDLTLVVSFPHKLDGILTFPKTGSRLQSPREAPLEGYLSELRLRKARKPEQKTNEWVDELQEGKNYFLRTRTAVDAQGKWNGGRYSKIYEGFYFRGSGRDSLFAIGTSYQNPESNSRDMEFDPKRNLLEKLTPLERVFAP